MWISDNIFKSLVNLITNPNPMTNYLNHNNIDVLQRSNLESISNLKKKVI
jgi:hypothetical protein